MAAMRLLSGMVVAAASLVLVWWLLRGWPSPPPSTGDAETILTETRDSVLVTHHRDTVPACGSCRLLLHPRATLGRASDAVLLREFPRVETDSRGFHYAAAPGARDHEILVFGPDGELHRTIGRFGGGPGEFRSVWDLYLDRNDTLYAGHEQRVSVFDPGGRFVRSMRLAAPTAATGRSIIAAGGELVLSEARFTTSAAEVVPPLHRYSQEGEYLGGYGPPSPLAALHAAERRAWDAPRLWGQRVASIGSDGSIWLASAEAGYRLDGTDAAGRLRRIVGISAPPSWEFPLYLSDMELVRAAGGQEKSVPPTTIHAIRPLDERYLMVVLHVAAPDWRSAQPVIDSMRSDPSHTVWQPGFREQRFDTVIDVIDHAAGALVAREKVRGRALLSRSGVLYSSFFNESGVVQVRLFDVSFSMPEAQEKSSPPARE